MYSNSVGIKKSKGNFFNTVINALIPFKRIFFSVEVKISSKLSTNWRKVNLLSITSKIGKKKFKINLQKNKSNIVIIILLHYKIKYKLINFINL